MISAQHYRMSIGTFNSRTRCNREASHLNKKYSTIIPLLCLTLLVLNIICITFVQTESICTTAKASNLKTLKLLKLYESVIYKVYPSHKIQNKRVHMLEGNKNSKGYKLSQWNCGSAFLENKMPELEAAVARIKPTIFCVSESNLRSSVDQKEVQIPGYKLITCNTIMNPSLQMSRVVVYLDSAVRGKVREDLMDSGFSSIWIELGTGDQKILVGCAYREHQFMKQKDHSSLTKEAQVTRWMIFIRQWNTALATGAEIHTLGDFNIDSKTFEKERAFQGDLTKAVMDQIIPQGVTQCVKGVTRWPQGNQDGAPTCIDHHWTTAPEKLSEVTVTQMGSSDHGLISAVRFARNIKSGQKYVTKRSYKTFDSNAFLMEVASIRWWSVNSCDCVDKAVEEFTKLICTILDREDMAPIKTFQQRNNYAAWLTDGTKAIMQNRDRAVAKVRRTKDPDDWITANAIRNRCTRIPRTEKHNSIKNKLEQCEEEKDISSIWKNIKGYLGWGGFFRCAY